NWGGYDVTVRTIDSFPHSSSWELRNAIKTDIEQLHEAEGVTYFHLIGDSNDYEQFAPPYWPNIWTEAGGWEDMHDDYINEEGWPTLGQPDRDIIPSFPLFKNGGVMATESRVYPYVMSDMPYRDVTD